ncbi:MAG: autotransporter-associated beta strand repeat-containing protein, partial [Akkermansiaceae bacterium]|nr:autotransporter-associated beta strand repeat-containing protein [Akkermansiaceae bacterium]
MGAAQCLAGGGRGGAHLFDLLNDPRYAHENGKPVVFIWGFPFADRNFTPASANAAVDYFKAQGTYVIGGIPNSWNSLSADWKSHIEKYHGVLVWQNKSTADAAFFRGRGQDFFPHIWPGFSWAHLKQLPATPPTQYTDRQGGQFYWDKGRDWINGGGADRLFIGMFDEYDESTHVMPMTDDPPNPFADYGRFIDNQGKPGDWWLMLTDELKRMMWGQRANTGTLPTIAALANRSNIGPEASVDLGATDIANSLTRVPNADDGDPVVETVGGKEGRGNASPTTTHRYLYFNVDNGFAFQLANGDVTVEVEYYDSFYGSGAGTVLGLQYDGAADSHTTHPQSITTTGSETWRTVRFEIADAWFAGRQNGGADFLLTTNGRKLSVNRVWVRLPEGKAHPFTWTNATAGPALAWSQNANWLGGIVAQSDPTSIVRFLPGQTLSGGTVLIENDLADQQFGTVLLGGTASSAADTTVTLGGTGFSLGGSAPAIVLDAMRSTFGLTYDLAAPLVLPGTAQVGGNGDATFRLSGGVAGTAGITKTGTSTLTLAGANAYSGDTAITSGTLRLGASDAIPDGPGKGGVVLTGTLDLNTFSETTNGLSGTGTVDTVAGGTPTLTLGGNDATSTFSGVITNTTGTLALTKIGSGTLTLAGVNSYTGPTMLGDGTVQLLVPNALPTTTALTLGTGATVGGLNLESVDQTIASLAVLSDSASANTLTIGAGQTLTITGGATIGFNSTANTTSRLTASGPGTLAITGGNLQLGGSTTTNVGSAATLDLSGLSSFIYHNSGGTVRVGDTTNANGGGTGSSNLILADDSTLTAASLTTNSPAAQQQFIKLGRGANTINANTVNIGLTGGRSSGGTLDFNEAGGTLKVRGTHSTDAVPTRANLT